MCMGKVLQNKKQRNGEAGGGEGMQNKKQRKGETGAMVKTA